MTLINSLRDFLKSSPDCLKEARPIVQAIFALRLISGAALSLSMPLSLFLGILPWACVTIFVYLYNGVMDVNEDSISGKNRPISLKKLSPRYAFVWAWVFACLGNCAAFAISPNFGLLAVAMTLLGFLYSEPHVALKRHWLGAIVAAAGGGFITFLAGWTLVADGTPSATFFIFSAPMAAWMGLVGAIVKDFSDMRGDAAAGRKTFVLQYGQHAAQRFAACSGLIISIIFIYMSAVREPVHLPASIVMAIGAVLLTYQLRRPENFKFSAYRIFMITQYGALLLDLSFIFALK